MVVAAAGPGLFYLEPQQKVVHVGMSLGSRRSSATWRERLGLAQHFAPDLEGLLDAYLKPMGMTFAELRRRPGLISSEVKYRKYLQGGFATPSGKVELY